MTKIIRISAAEVEEVYCVLDKIGCLGESRASGYLRAAYSDEETAAMKFIEHLALECGAKSRWDKAGNLALEWAGETNKFVETGSHIDTVPRGGNFDGAVGVVTGLLAIRAIRKSAAKIKHNLRLRIWRAEESSTFNVLYGGSKAAFGLLDEAYLAFTFQGRTLAEAMKSQGADVEAVRAGMRMINQTEIDDIIAHVELHIEQGRLLEASGTDVGIVTSIRASKRYRIVLTGDFDHSGGTPMGKAHRKDVNLAMAYIQVALDTYCNTCLSAGQDIVQTVGVINSSEDFNKKNPLIFSNAIPVISGFGYFSLEIRSNRLQTLNEYSQAAEKIIDQVARSYGVGVEIQLLTSGKPLEHMEANIQEVMEKSAAALAISSMKIASGAGHDTAVVGIQKTSSGNTIPVGMLFIPCKDGKSHCPEEYASYEAIAKGASVLGTGLLALANS